MGKYLQKVEDKTKYLDEHFFYEIDMMIFGISLSHQNLRTESLSHQNLRTEIVLLHGRNLIEFFFRTSAEVNSTDFEFTTRTTSDWKDYASIYKNISEGLSHMGKRPLLDTEKIGWPLSKIEKKILDIARDFLITLKPQYKFQHYEKLLDLINGELNIREIGGAPPIPPPVRWPLLPGC
jgi:hypothetical protein